MAAAAHASAMPRTVAAKAVGIVASPPTATASAVNAVAAHSRGCGGGGGGGGFRGPIPRPWHARRLQIPTTQTTVSTLITPARDAPMMPEATPNPMVPQAAQWACPDPVDTSDVSGGGSTRSLILSSGLW